MHSRSLHCCAAALVFTLLISCGKKDEVVVLPSDNVLIELLFDLHLAEASLTRVDVAIQDSIALILRDRVAGTHGITPQVMDTWLEGLQRSPDRLSVIYDSLIVRFEKASMIK